MSIYYQHRLIPVSSEHRPEAAQVATFLQGIVDKGHVADDARIRFSRVVNNDASPRQIHNAFTNETIQVQAPSRKIEAPTAVTSFSEISALADREAEYDVLVEGDGQPRHPPCHVGHIDGGIWRPMEGPYHLEIRCRVRRRVVRLYSLESPDDLHKPLDISKFRSRFDEDCEVEERDGLFVHPEVGALWISHAGCGTFWIEFQYGKWLFPRLRGNRVQLLDKSLIKFAESTFGTAFVEACN
jgi:hypothetical protein